MVSRVAQSVKALRSPTRLARGINPGRHARRQIAARDAEISALRRELARARGETRSPDHAGTTPVFFIVGHIRSGTTWLMRMLDAHPEILCRGEGRFFGDWRQESLKNRQVQRPPSSLHAAILDAEYLGLWAERSVWGRDGDADEHLANLTRMAVDYFLKGRLLKSGKRMVGDKSPLLSPGMIREIAEVYPEARVIHIIRDGRDAAVSATHHTWNFGNVKSGSELAARRDAYREDPRKLLESGGGMFAGNTLAKMAAEWGARVGRAVEDGPALLGANYAEVRYEDLLDRPEEEVGRLLEFLGAAADEEAVTRCVGSASFSKLAKGRERGQEDAASFFRKGVAGDWKNMFTERDKLVFKEEAGELLVKLGYERDDNW